LRSEVISQVMTANAVEASIVRVFRHQNLHW
jgi:hypothetical protein